MSPPRRECPLPDLPALAWLGLVRVAQSLAKSPMSGLQLKALTQAVSHQCETLWFVSSLTAFLFLSCKEPSSLKGTLPSSFASRNQDTIGIPTGTSQLGVILINKASFFPPSPYKEHISSHMPGRFSYWFIPLSWPLCFTD